MKCQQNDTSGLYACVPHPFGPYLYEKWIVDNLRPHVLIKEKFEKCFSSQFLLSENFGGVSGRRYLVYIFGVRERF